MIVFRSLQKPTNSIIHGKEAAWSALKYRVLSEILWWEGQRESGNVEDRRGMGPARVGGVGGWDSAASQYRRRYFTGINRDPLNMLWRAGNYRLIHTSESAEPPIGAPATNSENLPRSSRRYRNHLSNSAMDPRLVLFTGAVRLLAFVHGSTAQDQSVLDLSFFNEIALLGRRDFEPM